MKPFVLFLMTIVCFKLARCQSESEWKIVFYTGTARYAGTDDQIYFRINGDKGSTQTEYIRGEQSNFEAGSIDTFLLDKSVNMNRIGKIKSMMIGKSISLNSFSDWQLTKIELYQTLNGLTTKYLFYCNCWFKRGPPFSRTLILGPVDGTLTNDQIITKSSKLAVILATVFGISLLLIVVGLVAFIIIRKKSKSKKSKLSVLLLPSSFSRIKQSIYQTEPVSVDENRALTSSNTIQPPQPASPVLERPFSQPPNYEEVMASTHNVAV